MNDGPMPAVVAVIPCNDLDAAEVWRHRLRFLRPADQTGDGYRIPSGEAGLHVHLIETVEGWLVPNQNPFGVYIYAPRVAACALTMSDAIIGPSRSLAHMLWGMYEIALNGPDGLLVRIAWPSRLIRSDDVE